MEDNAIKLDKEQETPKSYAEECFDKIKNSKMTASDEYLDTVYDTCLAMLEKFKITGQVKAIRKLMYHLECIEREHKVVAAGVTKFVYRSDVEDYIDNVATKDVKIIELKNYERTIPDEIIEVVDKVGKYFDGLYVVFTDYTGKVERQIKKEERTADPILFGVFKNDETNTIIERFYYLGDWVDEYCDLTLDKMVGEMKAADRPKIVHSCKQPKDIEELKKQLEKLVEADIKNEQNRNKANGGQAVENMTFRVKEEVKPGFFAKVKSIFTKKNKKNTEE